MFDSGHHHLRRQCAGQMGTCPYFAAYHLTYTRQNGNVIDEVDLCGHHELKNLMGSGPHDITLTITTLER